MPPTVSTLYVADTTNSTIRKVTIQTGEVTILAGTGTSGFADGTGVDAGFNFTRGITSDGSSLYVIDNGNHRLRQLR